MFGLGMGELLVILIIVLLIFGAGKLPQVGDSLGRAIRNFKGAASGDNQIEVSKKKELTSGPAAEDDDVEVTARKSVPAEKTAKRS